MPKTFRPKSNSSSFNTQPNQKTVRSFWWIHQYRQYSEISKFLLTPPHLSGAFETLQNGQKSFFYEDFEELNISAILYVSNFFSSQNLQNRRFLSWAKFCHSPKPLLMQTYFKGSNLLEIPPRNG